MSQLLSVNGGNVPQPVSQSPVRTAVRFPIRLALTLQTPEGEFQAVTENISANGLLFCCEHLPAIDSRVEFTMAMPSAIMGTDRDVVIHCFGRIVRHHIEGPEKKAAVVIDEYLLKA